MKNIKTTSRISIHLPLMIVVTLLAYLISGCATIFSGTHQDVQVKPPGAKFEVFSWDGKLVESPKNESDKDNTVSVHRPIKGQSYLVRLQKDGYCPRYWLISHKENPVSFGNIILGGLIGIIIDNHSGAGFSYAPTEFQLNIIEDMHQCS